MSQEKIYQVRADSSMQWWEVPQADQESMVNNCSWQGRVLFTEPAPAAMLEMADLIRKQEARIDELTIVTGDQHMRLDAVLKVQAGLVAALKLAATALCYSHPMAAHYPEPVKRHSEAQDAVAKALNSCGVTL